MRIYHNQLDNTLRQGFQPVWLLFGDEPWQKNDALNKIKYHAQQQGFDELIRLTVDDKFNWDSLFQEYQSMSLFASLRIIELEFTSLKIGDKGAKAITELVTMLNNDITLIFHGAKIDPATQKRKWFKSLENAGCFIPLYDIEGQQLKKWLQIQATQLSLSLSNEVVELMAELFSGNLPALAQELEKLAILFGQQTITLDDAEPIIVQQAKFNPFQLTDTLLVGDLKKCLTILEQLQQEGTAFGQILWFVSKEIAQLQQMLTELDEGKSLSELYKKYHIWEKKKPIYQHALTNISLANCQQATARLAQVDLISKTSSEFNAFILLYDVLVTLYHGQKMKNLSLDYEFN